MSVQNSSGLASLTATYTDSEGEDDAGDISSPSPEKPKPIASVAVVVSPSVRLQVSGNFFTLTCRSAKN